VPSNNSATCCVHLQPHHRESRISTRSIGSTPYIMATSFPSIGRRTFAETFDSMRSNHTLLPARVNVLNQSGLTITADEAARLHLYISTRIPPQPTNLPTELGTHRFVTNDGAFAQFRRIKDIGGDVLDQCDWEYPPAGSDGGSADPLAGWKVGFMDVKQRKEIGYRSISKKIIRSHYYLPSSQGFANSLGIEEYDDGIRVIEPCKISDICSSPPNSLQSFTPPHFAVRPLGMEPCHTPYILPQLGENRIGSWRVFPDGTEGRAYNHKRSLRVDWSKFQRSIGLDSEGRHNWEKFVVYHTAHRSQGPDAEAFGIELPAKLPEGTNLSTTTCFFAPYYNT